MSSPAERGSKARSAIGGTKRWREAMQNELLPPGSLVFHTRDEVIEWLRGEGLVVLDKQQAETFRVYWCPICKKQTDRSWHLLDDGGLFPQLATEHECERIEVVRLLSAGEGPK